MAYDNPGPSGDMYDDAPAKPEAPPAAEGDDEKAEGGKSYVLPKEILMGKDFKPGEEIVLKITAVHDDRIEVSYAPSKAEGKEEMAPEAAPGGSSDPEMASMME